MLKLGPSHRRVLNFLLLNPGFHSATEIAAALGIHRTYALKILHYLERFGYVSILYAHELYAGYEECPLEIYGYKCYRYYSNALRYYASLIRPKLETRRSGA